MGDLVKEAHATVEGLFRSGYNCAESIVRGFGQLLNQDLGDETYQLFSGYGGGLGHAGCICGALNASIAVLGMFRGRKSNQDDRLVVYNLAQKFHDCFEDEFGATCCRVLNQMPFGTREQKRQCLEITTNTASLLMRFLLEEKLLSEDGTRL